MSEDSLRQQDATTAVPYSLRVAAAVSWRVLAVTGLLVVVGYLVINLRVVMIPVAVALLLTALLGPVVNWLTQRHIPRGVATTVVMFSGLALIGGLLAFVIQAFVAGLPELQIQVAGSVQAIRGWLRDPPFGLPPVNVENLLNSLSQSVSSSTITSGAVSTALTVGEILTGVVLALFTLIYFLYGGRSMWLFLVGLAPQHVRDRIDRAGLRGFASLVGFVRATLLVAVVDAIGIGIGLWAVGAPLVVPLMALVFLAAFVPVVGAVISGVVAVLVVLVAVSPVAALIVFGVVIGVQQVEGNILQPLLLGRAVALNGLAVVLAVTVGSVTAGITGALLAVPLLAVLNAGIRALVNDSETDSDAGRRRPSWPKRPGQARRLGLRKSPATAQRASSQERTIPALSPVLAKPSGSTANSGSILPPADTPVEPQPPDSQPSDSQPPDSQPPDSQPPDSQPSDSQPSDSQPSDSLSPDSPSSDSRSPRSPSSDSPSPDLKSDSPSPAQPSTEDR